ncbi:MAG: alanyl-tRNA editing protein, partial [Spirochaetaceae bacterium]|nr:alanyl-tRNA editing protein [Spirochaetaceae bacterium]
MHNCGVTEQLYHKDASILEFQARVDRVDREDGRTVVLLDQTAFYPEGGGQPADHGTLNGRAVVHVRKDHDGISHILANPSRGEPEFAVGDAVSGVVDGTHRRDYTQQHTGQHIISAALLHVGRYNTVSVHLGAEYTTIEVDAPSISAANLTAVQELANSTIERAIPVTSIWVSDAEISNYPLRRPPKVSGSIRLVLMGDVDCVACGGVHVDNTGKVRLVRAIGTEIIRNRVRISWKIGDRAVADYQMIGSLVRDLGDYLSAQPHQIDERVRRLEDRARDTETALKSER